jgi:hypothetical protein
MESSPMTQFLYIRSVTAYNVNRVTDRRTNMKSLETVTDEKQ